jgi:hypothetical protein
VDDRGGDDFFAEFLHTTAGPDVRGRFASHAPIGDLGEAMAAVAHARLRRDELFGRDLFGPPRRSALAQPGGAAEALDPADAGISEHQPGHAQRREDPRYLFRPQTGEASPVWADSQELREAVEAAARGEVPGPAARTLLRRALERQLPTLQLWSHVARRQDLARTAGAEEPTATLYVILFPGESPDGTGIKQLNDAVLGYQRNTDFIRERQDIIADIFDGVAGGTGFITVGQDYKTASIVASGRTRRDFAAGLHALDGRLKAALLAALKGAEEDARKLKGEAKKKERLRAIEAVRATIGKKRWRFDFLFGAAARPVATYTQMETVFLLLTEALKAAGVARFIAKASAVGGWRGAATEVAERHRAGVDEADDDNRGKLFDHSEFLYTLEATADVREVMSQGARLGSPFDYMNIFVNGAWTVPWSIYHPDEQRPIANPDVLRDARKRLLKPPPLRAGVKSSFKSQVELLELWLTAVNTIDLVKDFVVGEFKNELAWYHRRAKDAQNELWGKGRVHGARLQKLLTRDLRQGVDPLPVLGRASEYQFYARASDHADRIFFVMDVRDLGVDLLVPYEMSVDQILWRRVAGRRLLVETLLSSDPVNRRKRATYDAVVEEFRKAHGRAVQDPAWKRHVAEAFGAGAAAAPMPPFRDSLEVMMGGDEIFVAAHPAYAGQAQLIIAALDQRRHGKLPLNLRTAVAYSSAILPSGVAATVPPGKDQRRRNAAAHDEALTLASSAPGALKEFERTHRRIERLIEKVPRDPRREPKADPKRDKEREELAKKYRQELEALGLVKLWARLKHGRPRPLDPPRLALLLDALAAEDPVKATAVARDEFKLVDFAGRVVDVEKLRQAAAALEARVERDAARNNVHVDPPPVFEKPKLPKWLKLILPDRLYKLIQEYYDDDGRREWDLPPRREPDPPDPDAKTA